MRWKELSWLERIWVYNVVLWMILFSALIWLLEQTGNVVSPWGWMISAVQFTCFVGFILTASFLLERVFTRTGAWRGRQALMTRGLRRPIRGGRYTVLALPEGGKIMMRVAWVRWRPRPWPFMQPVALDGVGDFTRRVDAEDNLAIHKAWSELNEQARGRNMDLRAKRAEKHKLDMVSARINSQRPPVK